MKKLVIAGLVIVALAGSAIANAAPGPQRQGQVAGRGQGPGRGHRGAPGTFTGGTVVSAKRDGSGRLLSFAIKTREGKTQTVKVSAGTQYSAGMHKASSSIVKPKAMVGVQLAKAGAYTATRVFTRGPEEFTGGQVLSIKTGKGGVLVSFTIKRGDGKVLTITVSKSTKYFNGRDAAKSSIVRKGANVGVMLPKAGSSQALSVGVMPPGQFGRGGPGGRAGGQGQGHRFGAPK